MKPSLARRAGFTLPVVLAIVTILTLYYAIALHSLVTLQDETRRALNRSEFERQAMTAESRMSYLILTQPFGAAMLNIGSARNTSNAAGQLTQPVVDATATINLDNRPYRFMETADADKPFLAQVQDEAGLFNLYGATTDQLTRLFQFAGLGDQDASNLATELQTYNTDPTQHQPLRRPAEIFSRLDDMASLVSPKAWAKLAEKITAYPDNQAFNVNTAPAEVLSILFNVDDNTAKSVVQNREGTVIANPSDVGLTPPNPARAYTFSGGRLRFTFTDPKTGLTYRSSLILTPADTERPLWVENPRTTIVPPPPKGSSDELDPNDLDPFPYVPNLSS